MSSISATVLQYWWSLQPRCLHVYSDVFGWCAGPHAVCITATGVNVVTPYSQRCPKCEAASTQTLNMNLNPSYTAGPQVYSYLCSGYTSAVWRVPCVDKTYMQMVSSLSYIPLTSSTTVLVWFMLKVWLWIMVNSYSPGSMCYVMCIILCSNVLMFICVCLLIRCLCFAARL